MYRWVKRRVVVEVSFSDPAVTEKQLSHAINTALESRDVLRTVERDLAIRHPRVARSKLRVKAFSRMAVLRYKREQ